jgi:hypothetical protein
MRTRFRDRMREVGLLPWPGLRFRIDIFQPATLAVMVTRGTDHQLECLSAAIEGNTFEGYVISIRDIRKFKEKEKE